MSAAETQDTPMTRDRRRIRLYAWLLGGLALAFYVGYLAWAVYRAGGL